MRIVHIINSFSIGYVGIIKVATSTSKILKNTYSTTSEIWYPCEDYEVLSIDTKSTELVGLSATSIKELPNLIVERNLTPSDTIVVTHGSWRFPTKWGYKLSTLGYKWVYLPHGMLEPWSLRKHRIKKFIYFSMFEKPMAREAAIVGGTSTPEFKNLKKHFSEVQFTPSGIDPTKCLELPKKSTDPIRFLFLGRLHKKKGIMPLVEGWKASGLYCDSQFALSIVGYDDGEERKLSKFLDNCKDPTTNIEYLGPMYGEQKDNLLMRCTYYVLPSFSEGFATSVLDAIKFGVIPIISKGCNFPEAISENFAIPIAPSVTDVMRTLNSLRDYSLERRIAMALRAKTFFKANYSTETIAKAQNSRHKALLDNVKDNRS
jgi:glycosyltransferase involved in cell wall biosynthesis